MQTHMNNNQSAPQVLRVKIERGNAEKADFTFSGPFRIGRDPSCDVCLSDSVVSRQHAEVSFSEGTWWIRDLESANGTFVDGEKVDTAPLKNNTQIKLSLDGPILTLTTEVVEQPDATETDQYSVTHYLRRYMGSSVDDNVGLHTMMIRRAFQHVQKRQKRGFLLIIGVLLCLCFGVGVYAVSKHLEVREQRILAEDVFYSIKSLELEFAEFLKTARLKKDARSRRHLETYKARHEEMEENYDKLIDSLGVYGKRLNEKEKAILRIARIFGECEINMPEGFSEEVLKYVKKWKSTARLEKAIDRARRNGYISKIAETMSAHDLPPHFVYLALQESNFNLDACGPKTRYGIAKGMWQFIPSTAANYGLRTGPLVHKRQRDLLDDRHHFGRSTLAAARYLRDIYDTEAQASGLY